MPRASSSLTSKVKKWLNTQGYPLEMRVASALRDAGFNVVQSAYFGDLETGKARELDVIAFSDWRSANIAWQLVLVVECKVSKRHPWVLFTRDLLPDDVEGQLQYYRIPASRLGRQLILRLRRLSSARGSLPLFDFAKRPGYGVQEAHLGDSDTRQEQRKDTAYEAAAKIAYAANVHAAATDTDDYKDTPVAQIVLPVVIVDGCLFDTHLDMRGALAVEQIQSGVLDWRNPVGNRGPTWIRLVTEVALTDFVADAVATRDFLKNKCDSVIKSIDASWAREYEKHLAPPE